MTKILMVASEARPFAKTGGLGDVLGALPRALQERGEEVAVVLPRYRGIGLEGAWRAYADLDVWLGPFARRTDVYQVIADHVSYFLVDCPPLYDRESYYGDGGVDYPDNHVRFAVVCRAALEVARHVWRPHVLHCHDWQAALVPVYKGHTLATDPTFYGLPVVFTIHNLGYPGLFPREALADIGLDDSLFTPERLEFFGKLNLLKGGLVFADALTTVSKTYAREIQTAEFGFALDGVLRTRAHVLTGILNGVDYSVWNPETDPHIAAHYSVDDLSGKRVNKADLLAEYGLPESAIERPLIGIIARFTPQKGFDLVAEAAPHLAAADLSLVILGTGDPRCEETFRELARACPDKVAVRIAYDDRLAHKIEAGADMFLMPSRWEPCGLNQIYSLRYGTVPIVRATGGLEDTVDETTGFKFRDYSGAALMEAIRQALAAFQDREAWRERMRRGMRKDFSWKASAAEYAALYSRLLAARGRLAA